MRSGFSRGTFRHTEVASFLCYQFSPISALLIIALEMSDATDLQRNPSKTNPDHDVIDE